MDLFANLALGFSIAFTPFNLAMAAAGVILGTLIGALPGVGPVSRLCTAPQLISPIASSIPGPSARTSA